MSDATRASSAPREGDDRPAGVHDRPAGADDRPAGGDVEHVDLLVVGAGLSGVGVAARLRRDFSG